MLQPELRGLDEVAKFEAINGCVLFDERKPAVKCKSFGTIGVGDLGRIYRSGRDCRGNVASGGF